MKISVIIFLIISLGLIVYSNSLGNDFVWDDKSFVVQNGLIKNLRFTPLYFLSSSALAKGGLAEENYRPFLPLTYAIDYSFWKLNPLGYHITNLLFHIANALLLFYFVFLITKKKAVALFSSLFFLTHPVQTEAVTWISGRADVLFLFFYLTSLIFYVLYRNKEKLFFYFLSIFLFLCSLLSKEMAATLPLMLIIFDYFYGKKEKIYKRIIRYSAFFLILELYVFLRFNIIGKLAQTDYWTGQMYTTMLTMLKGFVYYIKILFFPLNLCVDYLTFPMSFSAREPAVFLSIAVITIFLLVALFFAKRQRLISFSILWFFITLLPVSNLIPIKILIAERFLYLPSIGYCIAIALAIVLLSDRFRKKPVISYSVFSIGVFLVISYSHLTLARNVEWSDEIILWQKTVEQYPDNSRARHNLAVAYVRRANNLDAAYLEVKKALEIAPEYPMARMMLAGYYAQNKKYDDAIREARRVLRDDPEFLQAYQMVGSIYAIQDEYELAFAEYRKALAKDPDFIEAKFAIANIYSLKENTDLAIEKYKEILAKEPPHHYRPHFAAAYLRMGELYADLGEKQKAISAWKKVSTDFKSEIWFSEISEFLTGKTEVEDLLEKTKDWQSEFKIILYYYIGIKNEMDGNSSVAKEYYKKATNIVTPTIEQFKILATERLKNLERS